MASAHPKLELVPLDVPKDDAIEIVPLGNVVLAEPAAVVSIDRFLREATQQYEEGHLDQALWDRALVQAGNDKAAATEAYLRGRATVLRLLDRKRRGLRTDATNAIPHGPATVTPGVAVPGATARARLGPRLTRHRNAMIAGAVLVSLTLGVWMLSGHLGSSSTSGSAVAQPVPVSAQPVARAQPSSPATKVVKVADKASRQGATPEFLNKMQELNDAGNWNVLVLYAVEWTRLEPANAAAWSQLSTGYVNLRQYRDALDAGNKAVELAPEDSRMWRNLGQINMDLNAPTEALRAFDRALAASPDDATARCLRMSAAQQANAQKDQKDPRAAPKPSTSFDSACRGLPEPVAAR